MKSGTSGILAAMVAGIECNGAAAGGLPVIDIASIQQETISAMEGVNQTLKMVQQYQLQLQQYENMIQNTLAPAAYVWNKVEQVNQPVAGRDEHAVCESPAGFRCAETGERCHYPLA